MKYLLVASALVLMATSCKKEELSECIDENKINPTAICTLEYNPVCGCDNKTYGNSCAAENNGVISWQKGECQ